MLLALLKTTLAHQHGFSMSGGRPFTPLFNNIIIGISGGSRIFPRGGREPSRGGREHAKFSRKLHEIERIWTPRGGVRPSRPPRSANGNNSAIHKAAGRPAAVQNGVWRSFCMAVPHRHFSVLQGTAGN